MSQRAAVLVAEPREFFIGTPEHPRLQRYFHMTKRLRDAAAGGIFSLRTENSQS